jgi:hypothetical protein
MIAPIDKVRGEGNCGRAIDRGAENPVWQPGPPKLLDCIRDRCCLRHLSLSTQYAYEGWIRRFILFHNKRHPLQMGGPEVAAFLIHLASERVRGEVRPQTWQAFWEVAVSGTSVAETAIKLEMTAGAVRVAKCRIIARLREVVAEMEKAT